MKNQHFEIDIVGVSNIYSSLEIIYEVGESFLKGTLDIADQQGVLWDTYQVEIKGSVRYPFLFPDMFEVGDAFPKISDWHVNEADGSCCIDVPPNVVLICKEGLKIDQYIKQYAIPYLANQTFRKREGYYLHGEYAHGIFGLMQYYQEKLKARNPRQMMQMFRFIMMGEDLLRTADCPFCFGTKFRKCHRSAFDELKSIETYVIQDANKLFNFFKAYPAFTFEQLQAN